MGPTFVGKMFLKASELESFFYDNPYLEKMQFRIHVPQLPFLVFKAFNVLYKANI